MWDIRLFSSCSGWAPFEYPPSIFQTGRGIIMYIICVFYELPRQWYPSLHHTSENNPLNQSFSLLTLKMSKEWMSVLFWKLPKWNLNAIVHNVYILRILWTAMFEIKNLHHLISFQAMAVHRIWTTTAAFIRELL